MDYRDRAIQAVAQAETTLQGLLQEAVATQSYRELAAVASAADAVSSVLKVLTNGTSGAAAPTASAPTQEDPPTGGIRLRTQEPETRRAARTKVILSTKRESYPRFLTDGDHLVKIAWSKSKKRPYEHRAPKQIVQELLSAIRKRKGEGQLFESSDILPLSNGNGEEYPSYQPYLALTWLRQAGVIAKRGRSGYILKPSVATPENIDRLWSSLAAAD